ncbi:D-glycero-D-manno-heptose 1,7-bisphosphate phosphatase [Verrucomicrobium sp. GAS474]|uniref:D-glycero-alpha-D-manno-heptose-1,7-bisphosphate 7-phosphatase n=1 Tax=Verrucomicrobium sp. GAS474 TaxID=1882831 RepID=UPI00087B31BA|nr:HAD-IIIA family hydrolase [Verrucomicrobium sp. GAS474]SDU08875.1 D-glycero-D-manno-heptose 1,7-bisphosphate phosphatase [Verrucomicrobium sp. GAS474]
MSSARKAVFLDRDDTIIWNVPYLNDPAGVKVIPGAPEALRLLAGAGFELFVVSNQSGIGRGKVTHDQLRAVTAEMLRQLGEGIAFRHIYHSYGDPTLRGSSAADLATRKPSPLLVHRAAVEYGIDLKKSFFIGDRLGDILCGRNAGCRTALVHTGENGKEWPMAGRFADFAADSLGEIAAWIKAQA